MKKNYFDVITELDLKNKLSAYQPTIIGTPPLKIDIGTSDIDIACTANNLDCFVSTATTQYSQLADFSSQYFLTRGSPAASCFFIYEGWEIELFCQTIPIKKQWGVRHFTVEKRLLGLQPELVSRVKRLKQSGLKTEPAFAQILRLAGDPFEAVLNLEHLSDAELLNIISRAIAISRTDCSNSNDSVGHNLKPP